MSAAGNAPPLFGLVLAGGRSTRMGRDKATLSYGDDTPQLERAVALLKRYVAQVFVSVRADQAADPLRARFAQIKDTHENIGPIAGLLAAQSQHPEAAWLVLACDLPLLDDASLAHLVAGRDAALPEPLCAIYEPRSHETLSAWVAAGKQCPRKFLSSTDTALLDEPNPRALDNINTPGEYGAAVDQVTAHGSSQPSAQASTQSKHITVQYYALLREQAGRREEALTTTAPTPRELYAELAGRYPFSLGADVLRVAINSEFGEWSAPLKDGDAVVFIPPVAGG